jgi:8-oxo-dGTP pyrophosphatase MutT (NUDIX family)
MHESDVIMVLPIIRNYFIIRKEFCPPYLIKDKTGEQLYYTTVTGKIEEGENPTFAMLRELQEESGIIPVDYTILYEKHEVPVCKSTDMRAHIYMVKINQFNKEKPVGDGTTYEEKSKSILVPNYKMDEICMKSNVDFLLIGLYNMYKSIELQ